MWVYLAVARHSFRRFSTYRVATFSGAVTNTVFGFIRAYVLIALFTSRPHLGGYDVTAAVTFCFLSQSLIAPAAVFGPYLELSERIRTGDVAVDLYRPVDLQAWWAASDAGRAAYQLMARGLPPFLVGGLVFHLRTPGSVTAWAAFSLSALLGLVCAYGIRYLTALGAFWVLDDRALNNALFAAATFCSGLVLPLVLLPGWLGTAVRALPWAAMLQTPCDVFLGRYDGRLWQAYAFQAAWAVALLLAGRALTGVARRRVVVQGG